MEQVQLKASLREGLGKQKVKALRTAGTVPAVVYHRGEEPVSIQIDTKEITRILRAAGGDNVLINLTIEKEKKKSRAVIIKEVQQDPVKRSILHVDFNEISLKDKITVDVAVEPKGESIGVKVDGGLLEHGLREVKISCLPTDIPKHLEIDISNLKLNDALHVKDLVVSDKIKILTDPEALLFQVKLPVEEKPEDALAETPELEVIREKKEDLAAAGESAKGGSAANSGGKKDEGKKEAPKAEKK